MNLGANNLVNILGTGRVLRGFPYLLTCLLVVVLTPQFLSARLCDDKSDDANLVIRTRSRSYFAAQCVVSAITLDVKRRVCYVAGDDHLIREFDADKGTFVSAFPMQTDWVKSTDFSASSGLLAAGGNGRQLHLWDTTKRKSEKRIEFPLAIRQLRFDNSGDKLAVVGFEQNVRIYSRQHNWNQIHEFGCSCNDLSTVSFSPDSNRIAVGGRSGFVGVWDLEQQKFLWHTKTDSRRIRTVLFSPDQKSVLSSGDSGIIVVRDAKTGLEQRAINSGQGKVFALTLFSGVLASAGTSNDIRLWEYSNGARITLLKGHTGTVTSLAVDPKTSQLYSGSFDTTIRRFDLKPWLAKLHKGEEVAIGRGERRVFGSHSPASAR